jgi:phosphatidylinositol glycan class O
MPRIAFALSAAGLAAAVLLPAARSPSRAGTAAGLGPKASVASERRTRNSARAAAAEAEASALVRLLPLVAPLSLIQGPSSPLTIALFLAAGFFVLRTLRRLAGLTRGGRASVAPAAAWWMLLALAFYYAGGHTHRFSSLQYSCGYVGVAQFSLALSGSQVFLNAVGGHVVAAMTLPMVGAACLPLPGESGWRGGIRRPQTADGAPGPSGSDWRAAARAQAATARAAVLPMGGALASAAALAALVHRRHLMVWAVFAPKLLMEATLLVTTSAALAAFALLRETGRACRRLP